MDTTHHFLFPRSVILTKYNGSYIRIRHAFLNGTKNSHFAIKRKDTDLYSSEIITYPEFRISCFKRNRAVPTLLCTVPGIRVIFFIKNKSRTVLGGGDSEL